MAAPNGRVACVLPVDVAVICALRCEADPIIEARQLVADTGAQIWHGGGVALAVSGVGAERAAAEVERMSKVADDSTCWLNPGCAGGRGRIGELVAAHRVVAPSGEDWYPQFPFPVAETTSVVHTVRVPETVYQDPGLYEMEAAGFYDSALKRSSLERVHVLKVRVDGPEHSVDELTASSVSDHIRRHAAGIDVWIDRLAEVASAVRRRRPPGQLVDAYLDRWRFTASQEVLLNRALERSHALSVATPAAADLPAKDAGEAIAALNRLASEAGDSWWPDQQWPDESWPDEPCPDEPQAAET